MNILDILNEGGTIEGIDSNKAKEAFKLLKDSGLSEQVFQQMTYAFDVETCRLCHLHWQRHSNIVADIPEWHRSYEQKWKKTKRGSRYHYFPKAPPLLGKDIKAVYDVVSPEWRDRVCPVCLPEHAKNIAVKIFTEFQKDVPLFLKSVRALLRILEDSVTRGVKQDGGMKEHEVNFYFAVTNGFFQKLSENGINCKRSVASIMKIFSLLGVG